LLLLQLLAVVVFLVLPAVALTAKIVPAKLSAVRFSETDPTHAWALVAQFAEGTCEQRFGYPSGYFSIDSKRTEQGRRLVMQENQPSGAVTDGCAFSMGSMSFAGFDEGFGVGCMMFFVVAICAAPFIAVSAADRFFRNVLRSRIDVAVRAEGPDALVDFRFFGPGGYAMRNRYARAFAPPELPLQFTVVPPEDTATREGAASDPAGEAA
jgi:hypothetical protein